MGVRLVVHSCLTEVSKTEPQTSRIDFEVRRSWPQVARAVRGGLHLMPFAGGLRCSAFSTMEHAIDSEAMRVVRRSMREADRSACEVMMSAPELLPESAGGANPLHMRFIFVPHFLSVDMLRMTFGAYAREPRDADGRFTPALLVVTGGLNDLNNI